MVSKGAFRIYLNIYDGDGEIIRVFLKSFIVDVRLGSKYASVKLYQLGSNLAKLANSYFYRDNNLKRKP